MKYIMDDTVPHCLECGDPLPYGRKDRTFCSPACKNRHHNREARQWRIRYASIIGILEKNHDILRQLIQIGVRSIPKEELIQLGYRMGFVTSSGRVGRRTVCRCFDVVFIDMETRISGLELESPPWDRELSGTA
jgi:predicted nucleic acid-binding Zn ribbon protein